VPARIEACDLPIMFELTQTADLSHWAGAANDPAWGAFLADVTRFVGSGRKNESEGESQQKPVGSRPPRRSGRPSLAILPFINRSELREDDVFANGMVADLTVALSLSQRMKVIASSATTIYRKEARDPRQIGRDLDVRYVLEGNVRRAGNNLRVTAQLVEAETDNILWTQRFDRPLAELADLQEELVTEVAAHLGVQVQRAEIEHALKKPGDITALEALLRSDAHLFRGTRAGYEAAIAEARCAVQIDPDYGPAYAVLAAAQSMFLRLRGGNDPQLEQDIADNIRRARTFDPSNPLVLCRIAAAYHGLGKPHEALSFAERAVALNPNNEMIRQELASVFILLGRADDAIAELDMADRLAPNGPWLGSNMYNRSVAHLHAGRLQAALDTARQGVRLLPTAEELSQLMLCLALSGRWNEALATLHRLRDAEPSMTLAQIEWKMRYVYVAFAAVEDYVGIARKLWSETEGQPK
jgi:TolB-like protein